MAVLDRRALLKTHAALIQALYAAACDADGKDANMQRKHELLAHLRATDLNVGNATIRYKETLAWKQRVGLDKIMTAESWRNQERALRTVLLYDYIGLDQHGRPMLVERVGAWNVSEVINASDNLEDFTLLHAMASETLVRMERPPDAPDPRGTVLIMDMEGLGFRHLSPSLLGVFRAINQIDEKFYPDCIAHIYIVKAPFLFSALQTLISPFLNHNTASKVHVSSGVPEDLPEHLGKDRLPQQLLGLRENVFPYDLTATSSEHPL